MDHLYYKWEIIPEKKPEQAGEVPEEIIHDGSGGAFVETEFLPDEEEEGEKKKEYIRPY